MISVLVVEDFTLLQNVICHYLERYGDMVVDVSMSTQDALKKTEYIAFDAIVTDYNLRDCSGIRLLRVLRERGDLTPVVYFTIDTNPILRRRAEMMGNVAFVLKLEEEGGSNFPLMEEKIREMVQVRPAENGHNPLQSTAQ
jgi:CheY-like chemotaxis protein